MDQLLDLVKECRICVRAEPQRMSYVKISYSRRRLDHR
ncbi:MAG: hypothetical protein ACLU9S_10010 [Oscillospiraceae bacterium]